MPPEIALAVDWAAAEGWNPGRADAACFATVDPAGFLVGEIETVQALSSTFITERAPTTNPRSAADPVRSSTAKARANADALAHAAFEAAAHPAGEVDHVDLGGRQRAQPAEHGGKVIGERYRLLGDSEDWLGGHRLSRPRAPRRRATPRSRS